MPSRADLRLRLFAALVFLAACFALYFTMRVRPIVISPTLIALGIAAMVAEVLSVQYGPVSISFTTSVCAAANILLGPAGGGLATGMSTLLASARVKEQPVLRGVYNVGQLSLTGLAAGWAYVLTGGIVLGHSALTPSQIPRVILPLAALAVASFVANTSLVGAYLSLKLGASFLSIWKSTFSWTIPAQAALTVLALALAQTVAATGVIGLGLFVVPLLIARQFYERYLTLKRAYADTVRSLVAVIEAKDAYTRGHSERVALYSVDVARRLGFSDQRVERIELAALLHDLGKVGISKRILQKRSRLSDEEFEIIKAHPDIGAHIIEGVPFLADLVPVIHSHHERVDGTGYGGHLEGEAIPIEARVLGVADAFDAMTSSRPYRAAMSVDQTTQELRRCAGQQFDDVIVETFLEALSRGAFADILPAEEAADEAV